MGAKRIQGKLDDGENIMVHGPSSELDKIRDTVQTGEGTGRIVFVPTD